MRADMAMAGRVHGGWQGARVPVLIGAAVCAAALIGIASRPSGSLALFWPANALLLGILLRWPAPRTAATLACAAAGYLIADLVTGTNLSPALWLAAANLLGVATGLVFIRAFPLESPWTPTPAAVVHLGALAAVSGMAAALLGTVASGLMLNLDWLVGNGHWLTAEIANYVVILPLFLTCPGGLERWRQDLMGVLRTWPGVVLAVLVLAVIVVGGPGAAVFPMPALLWLATISTLPVLTVAVAVSGSVAMLGNGGNIFAAMPETTDPEVVMSYRIGIALLALAPLAMIGMVQRHRASLEELAVAANTDSLTGLLNRRAFMAEATRTMSDAARQRQPMTAIMIDIDGFKAINDSHGHAAGDRALVMTAEAIREQLPPSALVCRFGGDEFVALVTARPETDLSMRLTRLRDHLAGTTAQDLARRVTVGIGIAWLEQAGSVPVERLVHQADMALYQAKRQGRDQTAIVAANAMTGGPAGVFPTTVV